MELTYSPARPEDAPVIFGFARELIERYETDPDLDLAMALDWTKRKIEKRIGEYTRVLADGAPAAFFRFVPDGERMELDDLYVLPAFRDKGVGTMVLRRCIAQLELFAGFLRDSSPCNVFSSILSRRTLEKILMEV